MATSTVNIEDKKKRKYIRGSSLNPDGSKHVVRYGYHSKVGTSVSYVIVAVYIEPIELKCPVKNNFVETSRVGIDPGRMVPLWWCKACYADARFKGVASNAWHDVVDEPLRDQILENLYPSLVMRSFVSPIIRKEKLPWYDFFCDHQLLANKDVGELNEKS